MDLEKIESGVRLILEGVGEDPARGSLPDTPARVARMYEEILSGVDADPKKLFVNLFDEGHQEMVIVHDIPVYSMCEHHMLPFFGLAHIAYIPNESGKVCGISKLARLVDIYARRLQVQERMTSQIADSLVDIMEPLGVLVVVECEHMCMTMRGVKKPGSKTTTSAVRGSFRNSQQTRMEALFLIRENR